MQLLHFSDTHNNEKAIQACSRVAAKWKEAYVTVTGDVCNCGWQQARPEFDKLTNPQVWFVRGNHDKYPEDQFGHLEHVEWQTPYIAALPNGVLVGLDSERKDGVAAQLSELSMLPECIEKKVLIVLHHREFSACVKELLITWAKQHLPSVMSIILLHGHVHDLRDFFAETHEELSGSINIFISNVYSANKYFRSGRVFGCANLFTIEEGGSATVQTVYDPQWDGT